MYLKRRCRSVQTSRLPLAHRPKTPRKAPSNMLAPPDGACTCLPPHPTLHCCSPSLMGDSTNAATVDMSQARKSTACLTQKKQEKVNSHSPGSDKTHHIQITSCFPMPSRSQRRSTLPLSAATPTKQKSGSPGVHSKTLGGPPPPHDQFSSRRIGQRVSVTSVFGVLIFQIIFALLRPLG